MGNLTAPPAAGPECLARNLDDVQACTGRPNPVYSAYNRAERRAAAASGARYIDVEPWFCSRTCSSVIGNVAVYTSNDHVSRYYAAFLQGVLAKALNL